MNRAEHATENRPLFHVGPKLRADDQRAFEVFRQRSHERRRRRLAGFGENVKRGFGQDKRREIARENAFALALPRQFKRDVHIEATPNCLIDRLGVVCRRNKIAAMLFDPLQHCVDHGVAFVVARLLGSPPLARNRVEFVKESLTVTGEDSPMATLMLSIMGAVAAFERAMILERQREGVALAKKAGVYKGRAPAIRPGNGKLAELIRLQSQGASVSEIARQLGVSRQTVYSALKQEVAA